MRNDHSIAGTTILQTTLEDADSTQFYWWLDKSGGKGSSLDFKTFRCSTPSSVGSHERKTYFSFHGYRLTMVLNAETPWSPNYYLYHRICLTINKIVYYQHLLVSFEELLSLRLSDHFALVVGCINNNWLNLWKKDACKVFTGISPPLWMMSALTPLMTMMQSLFLFTCTVFRVLLVISTTCASCMLWKTA